MNEQTFINGHTVIWYLTLLPEKHARSPTSAAILNGMQAKGVQCNGIIQFKYNHSPVILYKIISNVVVYVAFRTIRYITE